MRRTPPSTVGPRAGRLSAVAPCLWLVLMLATAAGASPASTSPASTGTGTATTSSEGGGNYPDPTSTGAAASRRHSKAKPAKCKAATGSVTSKNEADKTFTVHPRKGTDRPFRTNAEATFWRGTEKKSWADLAAGQNVRVTCITEGDTDWARVVRILNAQE